MSGGAAPPRKAEEAGAEGTRGGGPSGKDPTAGADSLGKILRRNLSARRLALLWRRGRGVLKARGWQALWREIAFRFNLAARRGVLRYKADIPLRRELKAQRAEALRAGGFGLGAEAAAAGAGPGKNGAPRAGEAKDGMPEAAAPPLISVIVPLYNTPPRYLRQMLRSVRRQSYPYWELVLADASDAGHPASARAAAFAGRDKRVKYLPLGANGGISQNTNAGIEHSAGEWLALLDHDDLLQPGALYELARAARAPAGAGGAAPPRMIFSDEAVLDERLKKFGELHFKGDFGPDSLRGCNTVTHLCAFTRGLLLRAGGGLRPAFDGAQDYDLALRLTEAALAEGPGAIAHIPKVLYFWRRHGGSTAAGIAQKPGAADAGRRAVEAQLRRLGLRGAVRLQREHPGALRVCYEIEGSPLVSVLIPNCDHAADLERCVASLYEKGGWRNLEVLVLENNSENPATEACYGSLQARYPGLRVARYTGPFNFSAINNFGERLSRGSHLLLLNNDVEITEEGFVRELLSYSQRPDVGAVGPLLHYPDGTVQHAGLIIGIGGTAGVSHKGHPRGDGGDLYRLCTAQNVSAVTGAALMVKRGLYREAGGLCEKDFAVAFNDVDFCLTLREKGLWNVFTPFAVGAHYESKSRGYDTEGPRKERFLREAAAFKKKWTAALSAGDPFYNPHLTLEYENFAIK